MITLDSLTLPPGLVWVDEFEPATVAQSVRRTLSGGMVVYHAALQAGRPITLKSEADSGWAPLSTVQDLAALASVPGASYTLMLREVSYLVMFAHHTPPALTATPVFNIANPDSAHPHLITLRLITI